MKHLNSQKGYSLIEVVVYITVFSLVSVVAINSLIISLASSKTAFAKRNLLEAGNSSMERITREIRNADTVVDANSTLGSSPGVLEISVNNPIKIIKFQVNSGSVYMYEDGLLYDTVSGVKTTVSSLIFRKIQTVSGTSIKIELVLQDSQGLTANFYNTVTLRGSY